MKKPLIIAFLLTLSVVMAVSVVSARPWETYIPPCKNQGQAGRSGTCHLHLVEKDPNDWTIVEDGAWGKLTFNKHNKFVFNGHGLQDGFNYELIYYCDPWPGTGGMSLGTGTADSDGNVHMMGVFDFTTIPVETDQNYPTGAKIWLVLDADFDVDHMVAWNPTEYLFEYDLL